MKPTLVSIPYSPWSIRAKLALQVMGVDFAFRSYTPVLSVPWVRLKLRRPVGRFTVPFLLWDGPTLTDSVDIVRWGCARSDRSLIPADADGEVARWAGVANQLLESGRIRATHSALANPEALRDSLPPFVRPWGPVGLAIGRREARRLLSKYGEGTGPELDRMREPLQRCSEALAARDTLLPEFSYADIVVAVGLSFVRPHASHPLGDRARPCWTSEELSEEFPDLLAWRDRTYAEIDRRRGR
jgi:glutathione S-transferase